MTISTWLAVCLISVPCGIVFGLTQTSSGEVLKSTKGPGFMLFGSGTFLQLLLSGLVNAVIMSFFFLAPSVLFMYAFGIAPIRGNDYYVWVFALFGGAAIGKVVRWLWWRRTRDFV